MPPLYERHVKSNYQQHNRKVMYFRTHFPHTNEKLHTFTYPLRQTAKGVSLPASRQKRSLFRDYQGSMTAEASLAVPLFLFFMINILSMTLFSIPLHRILKPCTSRDVSCPCWPMLRERRMR